MLGSSNKEYIIFFSSGLASLDEKNNSYTVAA